MKSTSIYDAAGGFFRRLWALIRKEFRQLLRDRSNLLIGIGLPIGLILIFGYGLSLDVRDARVAVVLENASPAAHQVVASLQGSTYIQTTVVRSGAEAQQLLDAHQVDAMLTLPGDFARRHASGDAQLQLVTNGGDPIRSVGLHNYVQQALVNAHQKAVDRQGRPQFDGVMLVQRMWFNAANNSTWYLVPGLIVLIMTLVGTFLTALVMAREWERGTLEALFVTPVHPTEVLLAKIVPYFFVGLAGLGLCLVASRFLFGVPMEGSLWVLLMASMIYMLVSLSIGLLISAFARNQFLASQVAILASFMPTMMLSGFVFDLRNVPQAVQIAGYLLPATYFMEVVKTLFLAGTYWPSILKNCGILVLYAAALLALARAVTRKRLD